MALGFSSRRLSLKARLIWSYLVILGTGGLATSLVGSWIVSSTIMTQARRAVDHDYATAKTVYDRQLHELQLAVQFAAAGTTIQRQLAAGDHAALDAYLEGIRKETGFDFLDLTDAEGRVLLRLSQPSRIKDDASSLQVVKAALAGKVAAATELLSAGQLGNEDPALLGRASLRTGTGEVTAGMTLVAAAPVEGPSGNVLAVLYGGVLLTRNFAIVDRVWDLLFRGDRFKDVDSGSVTIFQDGFRISTNVRASDGERALGSPASADVRDAVLKRGETWRGRAFVVKDWYISEYDPIRNYAGDAIGMLSVGILESTYNTIRNRVILSFFGIATLGFLLIIGITYYMILNITHPIGEMVAATQHIIAGRFDQEVRSNSPGEIALLAESFNAMLKSLRQMKADLEEWGRTLEEKVKQRTEELVAMQARVAQSERLASLGMLAAGVAHEVNNPLGGILALTALTVEDMPKGDPNRENLEEVIRQTVRCRDIVKGLLEFSRQSKANTERVDLNKVLQETLALVAKQALFFNINVVSHLDPELPTVMADRSQFQQVFMNIVMNAVQAMDERGAITITSRRDAPQNSVEVAIQDTGRGIPPQQIDRIFDPFFTTKESGHGTGLGLSIAYGIVTTHRGTISVVSEVGKGSTFTIRMPIAA
ncbi:MAG TPA: cache domain-containing protein [Bryobacteraceae bacterium]|nr:cache domain-containing protein [Bryobacteraceae bacterium]